MSASAAEFLPNRRSLTSLRQAAAGCRGCDLWKDATQTVFGEGRARAELMLVGEQPGDQDASGRSAMTRWRASSGTWKRFPPRSMGWGS